MSYKVGQIVRNPRTKLARVVSKVVKGKVYWISKDGKKKGSCLTQTMKNFQAGRP